MNVLIYLLLIIGLYAQSSIDIQLDRSFIPINKDNDLLEKHDLDQEKDISGKRTLSASYHFTYNQLNPRITLSYFSDKKISSNILSTDPEGNNLGLIPLYIEQTHFSLDLSISEKLGQDFFFGYGPSLNVMKRSHFIKGINLNSDVSVGSEEGSFNNSIYGYGIGAHLFFEFRQEINDDWKFFLQTKARWISHVLYSSGENDTSDYNHYYLICYISLGFNYSL